MNSKHNIVDKILELIGNGFERAQAEQMFDVMRCDGRIFYADDYEGFQIRDGVDLIAVAVEVING